MRPEQWDLRLRIFLFFALIGLGGAALIAGAMVWAHARIGPGSGEALVLCGGVAAFALVLLTGWVWQLFDENVARPIKLLAGELEAKAHADTGAAPLPEHAARYLGDLGPAATGLTTALAHARGEAGDAVADAVGDALAEKAQLAAVLRDLREAVLICNPAHEILLYNTEAQRLLGLGAEIGLGRSLFRLIAEQPVRHALQRLTNRVESGRYRTHRDHLSVALVTATCDGTHTLEGRVSLIVQEPPEGDDDTAPLPIGGFVVTFRDATKAIADHAARDHLLSDMLEGLRRPAANLRAAVEVLGSEALGAEDRTRLLSVVSEEAGALSRRVEALSSAYEELRPGGWSMNDISSKALVACVAARLGGGGGGGGLSHTGEAAWLHCDSFTVVELLGVLVGQLRAATGAETVTLSATRSGAHVFLDLSWDGTPVTEPTAERWLAEPLAPALARLTGADVLRRHRTEIWSERAGEGRARLRLPLPPAVEDHEKTPAGRLPPRPEFYDFGLLSRTVPEDMGARPLSELAYVVFDTETTGLFPSAGDEIVQIAGLRMLGHRVIMGERFDRLVDPGRRVPAASTAVHGITDEMVAGEPGPEVVLPAFHDFAEGAVLIAHNAPFDMKFLSLKEGLIGRRFDHPVLDTVLLSAHLFGQEADHRLDALAERFGVGFDQGARHTAFADAVATAEVLSRMLPALEAKGVRTLGDALTASEAAGAIRRKQAQY